MHHDLGKPGPFFGRPCSASSSAPRPISKLGGEPTWCQNPEVPKCKSCKEKMTFVAQLDSMEHDEDHNPHAIDCLSNQQQYMFGDVGMIYVFMCFDCMETKSVLQCG